MITVNGVDLASRGFTARSRSLSVLGGERTGIIPIPGAPGGVRSGGVAQAGTLRVEGHLSATSHGAALTRADELAKLLSGEQRIGFSDYPDREWVGWLQPSTFDMLAPAWAQRAARVALEWLLPDPRAVAIAETVRTGPGALTLGSAASGLVVEASARTALTVRVRTGGAGGTVLRELVWTGAATGLLVVDGEAQTVVSGGANAIDGITAASTFPVADPAEGADFVEVPADVSVRYRRRWRG